MIGSSHRRRAKSPLGTVLIKNLLGKGLTPRACMGDGGSIWWAPACDHLKTSKLSADSFKKYSTLIGRHLSPRYGQVIVVSGYPVLTAVSWWQRWCAISFLNQLSPGLPKVARKCESKHWYACGADGRSLGRSVARSLGHVIPNFSEMGRFP